MDTRPAGEVLSKPVSLAPHRLGATRARRRAGRASTFTPLMRRESLRRLTLPRHVRTRRNCIVIVVVSLYVCSFPSKVFVKLLCTVNLVYFVL